MKKKSHTKAACIVAPSFSNFKWMRKYEIGLNLTSRKMLYMVNIAVIQGVGQTERNLLQKFTRYIPVNA